MQNEVLASLFAKENKETELKKEGRETERSERMPDVQWDQTERRENDNNDRGKKKSRGGRE